MKDYREYDISFESDKNFPLKKSEYTIKDWHYRKIMQAPKEDYMNTVYDYTKDIPFIYNQQDTGFCWAYSTALMQSAYEAREIENPIRLSPLYIAKRGKELDGDMSTEGSTTKNSVEVITKFGTIKDEYYKEEIYHTGTLEFPNIGNEDKLRHYKSKNYARLNGLNDIVLALSQGKLPLIGIQCTKDIYKLKDGHKFLEFDPEGKIMIIGGHQVLVVGWYPKMKYNGHTGFLKCANSWGEKCGDKGFFFIPRDYIEFRTKDGFFTMLADAFATVDLRNDNIKGDCIELFVGHNIAYHNDKPIVLDSEVEIKNDRTYVPMRAISEMLGASVKWYEFDKKIVVKMGTDEIKLFVAKNYAIVNGKKINMSNDPPYIKNNRCMVPLRFIVEALHFVVLWHGGKNKKISILK